MRLSNKAQRLLLLTIFICAISLAPAAKALNVNPFISCIEPFPGGFIANFGYENLDTSFVTVDVGANNFFSPNPANRNQPSIFLPGFFERAFRVTYIPDANNPSLIWTFLGNKVFANAGVRECGDSDRAPLAATLEIVSGGSQTATAGQAFAQPIVVLATFAGPTTTKRPLQGLTLKLSMPGSGPSASLAATVVNTDTTGKISITPTANSLTGMYNLTISVGIGANPVTTINVPLRNQ
jgi:hypothetical protein